MRVMSATEFQPDPVDGRTGLQTIRSLLPYLWPSGAPGARVRVVMAIAFLVAAKVATVYIPLVYSHAVDALAPKNQVLTVPLGLIGAYALLRIASSGFGELRDAVFASVQQRTIRKVALQTFEHLHKLSLRFHLDRQTGGLSRAIERGTAGVEAVLRLAVFNILPTLFEVLLVTVILWRMFDWRFALVTFGAVALFIGFTVLFTDWRVKFRRLMNDMDSDAQTKAVDSLLNFETVKYFGNEAHEARRFDGARARYERAAVRSQVTLNMLNLGQALIISLGLALVMLMAADGVQKGTMTVGQFVLVNTYLMQLYQPLNFLGFVYREIKQGLVDMESMFRLMSVHQEVADRPGAGRLAVAETVSFKGVHFGYNANREILKGVSFTVPAGSKLAIVGPTGAGQEHDLAAVVPVLRRVGRVGVDRWGGCAGSDAGEPAGGDRRGAAGHGAVQRHDRLQHRLRATRGHGGRGRAGGAVGAGAFVHRELAGRL